MKTLLTLLLILFGLSLQAQTSIISKDSTAEKMHKLELNLEKFQKQKNVGVALFAIGTVSTAAGVGMIVNGISNNSKDLTFGGTVLTVLGGLSTITGNIVIFNSFDHIRINKKEIKKSK